MWGSRPKVASGRLPEVDGRICQGNALDGKLMTASSSEGSGDERRGGVIFT